MHESSAFDLFVDEGRVAQSHRLLLRLGTKQFGQIDPATDLH